MQQNEQLAQASLAIALSEVGQKEATGNNDGPFVNMVQEFVGGVDEDGAPWCACFESWCLYKAAESLGITPQQPKSDSSTELYSWAKQAGALIDTPVAGCLGLLKGDGGTSGKTHHHTFRVVSVDLKLGIVHSVDGNWGNAVALTTHPIRMADFAVIV